MRGFTLPRAGLLICAGLAMLSASCGSGTNDDLARLDSSPDPAVIAADAGRGAPVIAEMEQGALTRDGINADGLPPLPQPTRSANRTVLAVPGKNAMQKSAGTSISGERLVVQLRQTPRQSDCNSRRYAEANHCRRHVRSPATIAAATNCGRTATFQRTPAYFAAQRLSRLNVLDPRWTVRCTRTWRATNAGDRSVDSAEGVEGSEPRRHDVRRAAC